MRLLITFPFRVGTPGGGTLDSCELARHLALSGVEVALLTPARSGPSGLFRRRGPVLEDEVDRAESLSRAGVEVLEVPAHPAHHRLDGLRVRRALKKMLATRRFDAVLGYWHEAFFLPDLVERHAALFAMTCAASLTQFLGQPDGWSRPLRRLRNRWIVRAFRSADVVFARSAFTLEELRALAGVDPARVRVVHLGVDPRFFEAVRIERPAIRDLIYYGRLVPSKGIFDALLALGILARRTRQDWKLRVAGWGNPEPVRRIAREQGIEDRIEVLGPLAPALLVKELERAQLALLPSYTESFGLANAESQAAGLPVVGYSAGAVPEVVEHGSTGWLVPPHRIDLLADALEQALSHPEQTTRAGMLARGRMKERFSWERTASDTLDGIEQALVERRRPRSTKGNGSG